MNAQDRTFTLGRCAATIPVSDIERALAFYRDVLGLEVTFENGSPVGFVILKKDQAEIHLTLVRDHKGATWNVAHLLVDDATALHDRCVNHGHCVIKGLRDKDYGLRAFVVADPDGNRIDVGEKL
jgi:predicted enzyme related to lactoylglutathione lyase